MAPSERDARPRVVAWGHSAARRSAGWRLRVRWPLEWLKTAGSADFVEVDQTGAYVNGRGPAHAEGAALRDADPGPVVGFGAWLFEPAAVRRLRDRGYRIVMGLDDDYWSIPEWAPGAAGDNRAALETIEAVLAESDVVVVTTAPLADHVRPLVRAVRVIENALPVARLPLSRPNLGQKIRVGWAGTSTHHGDWDAVRAPIEALLERPEVRVVLLTKNPPRWLAAHPRVELHKPVGFDQYYETLAALHLDVGVAPLVEHVFNHSKSHLKMLDYAALGLPAVASRVGPYRDLPHGTTCLTIADNDPDAWGAALSELVEDPERRRTMGTAARAWVETHGSLNQTGGAWAEALGLPSPAPATGAA